MPITPNKKRMPSADAIAQRADKGEDVPAFLRIVVAWWSPFNA
jgi:hypothetical protein